ncbi:short-chain fatty acid transporter [Fusibacter ferrireducens]|uniref:Short-chain fatty acid transporter n=1 Tax=Fusibacter ferrireducens TaxID=2785058 RepID=A0ABR9ZTN6_9FIRM|nr:TIGR00366 family protein [Fusibacter ferrireducens]MBF4693240.1 short-chain fatty acid transporter [Fusibacter ferrireducens]
MFTNTNAKKSNGSLLWRFSQKFEFAAENIIPDPLVFCLILTLILFVSGVLFTDFGPTDMVNSWFKGIWSQIGFAFQMSFMVVTCSVTARSKQVKGMLSKFAGLAKTPVTAIILLMIFGYVASFMNWAFGTIATPVLAMLLSKKIKGLHFPMLIAAGYSTMILGQCLGPSASVYALIAGQDHFLVDKIGVITQDVSVYNPLNTILFFILAIGTIILTIMAMPPKDQIVEFKGFDDEDESEEEVSKTTGKLSFADRMNGSRLIMYLIGLGGLVVIGTTIFEKGFLGSLSLNFVIFIFLIANFFLYGSPAKFVGAYKNNMSLATDVMIQFPFYGGISGMMIDSGLGQVIVGGFTAIATAETLPFFAYISASIVNLFIPSQGGQIIVQGPILIDAALSLKANVPHVLNAFVYGDEATNLLQPLYVIPALAIVRMKLKDVWGYMAFIWLFWLIVTSIGLLVLPNFF